MTFSFPRLTIYMRLLRLHCMHTVHFFRKSCPGRHQKCHLCVWVWVGNGFMLVVPPLGCHRTLNNCLCQGDTDPSQSHRNGLFMLHQNQTNAEIEKSVYTFQSVPGWMARGFTQCMGDKHRVMGRPISFSIALLDHYHRNGPVGLLGSYMQEYAGALLAPQSSWQTAFIDTHPIQSIIGLSVQNHSMVI